MQNTIDLGLAKAPAPPSPDGELSDAELEFVVGGLTRAWSLTPDVAVPSVTALPHSSDSVLKTPSV
jgi:hypothetical protein